MKSIFEIIKDILSSLKLGRNLSLAVSFFMVVMVIIAILSDLLSSTIANSYLLPLLVSISILAFIVTITDFYRTLSNHPRSLSIALIGPPAAGKTVYMNILFGELETKNIKGLRFAPYGTRTIEFVSETISLMKMGKFPPATMPNVHRLYEAVAAYGTGFFDRRYRIQITDYAGEHLSEFDPDNLIRTSFYQDVTTADALLVMIDCERILDKSDKVHDTLSLVENRLIATIHTFVERKASDPTTPIQIPIGLLLSKSDLLTTQKERDEIQHNISRLISVCQKRFRYFKIFEISSIGNPPQRGKNGEMIPPREINPKGVIEPILWILGR